MLVACACLLVTSVYCDEAHKRIEFDSSVTVNTEDTLVVLNVVMDPPMKR